MWSVNFLRAYTPNFIVIFGLFFNEVHLKEPHTNRLKQIINKKNSLFDKAAFSNA